jgi:hypothetical protein
MDKRPPDRKRHFEYNRKELAVAVVRSPELFVNPAQKVDSLTLQVSLLTAEVGSVKNFESQASDVIGQLVRLSSVLQKWTTLRLIHIAVSFSLYSCNFNQN